MPKVLFAIGSLGLGGAESQMALLIRELSARDWQCELFVLEARGSLRDAIDASGAAIHDGGYDSGAPGWRRAGQIARALLRLWFVARRARPDVLHAFLPLTNFLGAVAGWAARVPLVLTSRRALGTHQDRHPLWKPFDRVANALSHRITVNSRAVGEDTVARDAVRRDKLVLIPNGMEFSRFDAAAGTRGTMRRHLRLGPQDQAIVAVGNLLAYKGHDDLVRALPAVLERHPRARLFLAGEDRGREPDLRQIAASLAVLPAIVFLGRRDDVPALLAAMDVFVLPSHEEGFSNALLEAMASGLGIVATNVGGNPEALDHGACGLLVPARDPVVLAQAVSRLLGDEGERAAFGRRASDSVRTRYPVSAMVDAHLSLYRQGSIDAA
ncbi:MAG: glycosyltransferase [Burkholderiaceae bacterium]|nr:glycosyltransferase [Burkholderiaceae bacterium]